MRTMLLGLVYPTLCIIGATTVALKSDCYDADTVSNLPAFHKTICIDSKVQPTHGNFTIQGLNNYWHNREDEIANIFERKGLIGEAIEDTNVSVLSYDIKDNNDSITYILTLTKKGYEYWDTVDFKDNNLTVYFDNTKKRYNIEKREITINKETPYSLQVLMVKELVKEISFTEVK